MARQLPGQRWQWHPLTVDHEVIHVRGRKDVNYDVRLTDARSAARSHLHQGFARHRPQVDALRPNAELHPALRDQHCVELDRILCCSLAVGWPTQNVVYSDDQGHIGYHAVGKIPIRPGAMAAFNKPLPHQTVNQQYEWGIPAEPTQNPLAFRSTFPSTRCPTRSTRHPAFWPPPTRASLQTNQNTR